jgi:hypothetical protein
VYNMANGTFLTSKSYLTPSFMYLYGFYFIITAIMSIVKLTICTFCIQFIIN